MTIEQELKSRGVPYKEPWISTMVAYGDEAEGLTDEQGVNRWEVARGQETHSTVDRNLDFKATEHTTLMEWVAYFPLIVPGYNAFDAECAEAVGKLFADALRVIPAREGSVCVYIVLPAPLAMSKMKPGMLDSVEENRIAQATKADEVSQNGSVLRLWWD